jgi:hypothetical protein
MGIITERCSGEGVSVRYAMLHAQRPISARGAESIGPSRKGVYSELYSSLTVLPLHFNLAALDDKARREHFLPRNMVH